MVTSVLTINQERKVRVRGIALPNEHGSWGFLFEPIVAAVAIAPSIAAFWIVLLVVGAFLTRQPLKILLSDLRTKQSLPQTAVALKFVFLYGAICSSGLVGSLIFADPEIFIPFALIAPFAIYQIYCDVLRKGRHLVPELTGATAISSTAAVIALAGGWSFAAAFALWGVLILRLLPSIVYVRNRLRLEKGKEYSIISVAIVHFLALAVVGILSGYGLASKLTVAMFVILTGRALFGLSPYRREMKAMKIGIWEVIYGILTVLSIVIGYYLGV